jgi:hypothetical protein
MAHDHAADQLPLPDESWPTFNARIRKAFPDLTPDEKKAKVAALWKARVVGGAKRELKVHPLLDYAEKHGEVPPDTDKTALDKLVNTLSVAHSKMHKSSPNYEESGRRLKLMREARLKHAGKIRQATLAALDDADEKLDKALEQAWKVRKVYRKAATDASNAAEELAEELAKKQAEVDALREELARREEAQARAA